MKYFVKVSLNKSKYIIVTNSYEKKLVSQIVKKEIIVIPNGIENSKFLSLLDINPKNQTKKILKSHMLVILEKLRI